MLRPSYAMTKGKPTLGAVVFGNAIEDEKEIKFSPLPAVTVRFPVVPVFVKVAETCCGLGGRNPASYPCTKAAIWLRRHVQSSFVMTGRPSLNTNGFGREVWLNLGMVEAVEHPTVSHIC